MIKKKFLNNSGSTYNFNVLLTTNAKDFGFFDSLEDTEMIGCVLYANTPSGYSFVNSYNFLNYSGDTFFSGVYTVTGTSNSRLQELAKYVVSNNPFVRYISGGNFFTDGLAIYTSGSTGITHVYYIGGIQFTDISTNESTSTTFTFTSTGLSTVNFDNKRIIKYESKLNMVENPQVNKDVFIVRQEQPVFEKNYRLRGIGSLSNIISYAGGNYFTIYNNT